MHIQIYSKRNCTYCTKSESLAKKIVENSDHTYEKFMLNEHFTIEELVQLFPLAKTFPQITIDKIKIGGYQELKKIEELANG